MLMDDNDGKENVLFNHGALSSIVDILCYQECPQ